MKYAYQALIALAIAMGLGGLCVAAWGSQLCTITPARPAGNTGHGFYVVGSKLYDKYGNEFRIRGVNSSHPDASGTMPSLPQSGANTVRFVIDFTKPAFFNYTTRAIVEHMVPMPSNWTATCKADVASLDAIVDTWVAQAPQWTQLSDDGLINIANEWGPEDSVIWRDAYIKSVARMRAAGYTGTLVIDSGACGQDAKDIVKYGAAVLAADPQHNLLFDVHVYGGFHLPATLSWMQDYATAMGQLRASGLPIIFGEFGPGKNIGPSPTTVAPATIIATAEANGWGWLAWSWDGNNLPNCRADDTGFSLTTNCGNYATDSDLTSFGKLIVSTLKTSAKPASVAP